MREKRRKICKDCGVSATKRLRWNEQAGGDGARGSDMMTQPVGVCG